MQPSTFAFKQFGYRRGNTYDKSYKIERIGAVYVATVDFIERRGSHTSGTPVRTTVTEWPTLLEAQHHCTKA